MSMSTAQPPTGDGRSLAVFPDVAAIPDSGVLLHVGVHKTGTTAIQAALADARPELRKSGILYPGKRQAQHRSAMAVTQRTWGWKNKGGDVYDMSIFDWLAKQTAGHTGRVAISSEFFCESDAETAATVVRQLGGDRVHVVITLRNLGRLLPSSWQQYLKYGLTTGYEKWLKNILENPGGSSMTPSFWRRNDHGAVVQRWADAAGADNVTVMVLEDVDRSAMFRTFAQLLDLDPDVLVSRMDLTSNRSMTAAEAELLIRLNRRVTKELTWDEYVKYVRRGVALGMVEGREPAPDEPRLGTPDWALDAAAEQGRIAVDAIRGLGVRLLGDLDRLGDRVGSPPAGEDGSQGMLPVDAAVQAVITVVEATRDNPELSVKDLRSELWSRTKDDLRLRWRMKSLRP
ncbi:MAG: hypothetical protein IPO93_00470 [Actinobacteria bacterium]|jgi:hypothetical protein|nr:hypothetical protein [Actinomycetota bacterium]